MSEIDSERRDRKRERERVRRQGRRRWKKEKARERREWCRERGSRGRKLEKFRFLLRARREFLSAWADSTPLLSPLKKVRLAGTHTYAHKTSPQ